MSAISHGRIPASRRWFLLAGAGAGAALGVAGVSQSWRMRRVLVRTGLMKAPANRLRNADFSVCTNPPIPDYWGTEAARRVTSMSGALSVDDAAPLAGTRSLRVHNQTADDDVTVLAHPTFVPEAVPHTLSAYVKTDGEERQAQLTLGFDTPASLTVGRAWRRVHVTYTPAVEAQRRRGLAARVSLVGPGTMWLAAPQLEAAGQPTPFATALIDDHPLPELPWGSDDEWSPPGGDTRRALELDGRSAALTAIAVDKPTPRQLADIASHGFDAIALFIPSVGASGEYEQETAAAIQWLDDAAKSRLRVVAFLGQHGTASVADLSRSVVSTVRMLKSHPAIVGWLVLDEPSHRWPSPPWDEIAAIRSAVHAEDPTRPVIVNDYVWPSDPAGPLSATDIGSVDIYPIGEYSNSLKPIADLSWRMNRACAAAGRPTAMWLQLYGFDDAVREPTPDEQRAMSYATFVHGTRLLFYWIYKPMNERLWASMTDSRREIRRLEAIVCADGARCEKVGVRSGRVHYAMWSSGARTYLVACNVAPASTIVRFGLDGGGAARDVRSSWYDSGPHRVVGRQLWARLPAFGRQVWELS